jgi:hypothetical protein
MPIISHFFGIYWTRAEALEPLERIPGADSD